MCIKSQLGPSLTREEKLLREKQTNLKTSCNLFFCAYFTSIFICIVFKRYFGHAKIYSSKVLGIKKRCMKEIYRYMRVFHLSCEKLSCFLWSSKDKIMSYSAELLLLLYIGRAMYVGEGCFSTPSCYLNKAFISYKD